MTNPHPDPNENPEECVGESMLDPWSDDSQGDWENNPPGPLAPQEGEADGVGSS